MLGLRGLKATRKELGFFVTGCRAYYDVSIIGGGIVGLAVAYKLKLKNHNLQICVVEKENQVGTHQSGRNSGVLHAGIYYPPGSDRAKLCVVGLEEMYEFLNNNKIPHSRCGKLIVAVEEKELKYLNELYQRAQKNQCKDIKYLEKIENIKEIEPHCTGIAAIHSPHTGIVNFSDVTIKQKELIEEQGSTVHLNFFGGNFKRNEENGKLTSFENLNTGEKITTKYLINCSGSNSDRVAEDCGLSRFPAVIPVRGRWSIIKPEYGGLVKGNIYPVPNPQLPFLGVHFTKKIGSDEIWSGPNSVLAFSREGYSFKDVNWKDIKDTVNHPGFYKMLLTHWKSGAIELYHELFFAAQLKIMKKYIPELKREYFSDISATGVRASVITESGVLLNDFVFETDKSKTQLHIRNASSPAATASFAVANKIIDKASIDLEDFYQLFKK